MSSNLHLSLILNAVDRLTGPLHQISNQLNQLRQGARSAGAQLNQAMHSSGASMLGKGIRGVIGDVTKLTAKVSALGGILGFVFNKQFIETAAEFQQLRVAILSIEGSKDKAEKVFRRIQDFAKNTPLEVKDASKAWVMLRNAGIGPVFESLQALSDINAKTGKDQENFIEIANQVSQAWLKNKLQMEEVVVLNERGIAVVPLLAKAMRKSEDAITDMIGKGRLGRKEIALLLEAIGKDAKGAAEAQSKTWNGMMSTLSDTWKTLVDQIMNSSGTFGFLSDKLLELINHLNFLQTAEGLKTIDAAGKKLYNTVTGVYDALVLAWGGVQRLAEKVGGFGNLAKIVFGGIALAMLGPLLSSIMLVVAGATLMTTAFAANPILLGIGLVTAAVAALWLNWDKVVKSVKQGVSDIKDFLVNGLLQAVEGVTGGIKLAFDAVVSGVSGIGRAIANIATFKSPFAGGETLYPSVESMMAKVNAAPLTQATGKPLTTLKSTAQKADVGGKIEVEIKGPGKVTAIKSDNPKVPLKVSTGLTMAGAY